MKKNFLGLDIDILDKYEALNRCHEFFKSNNYNGICFINSHCYNVSRKNYIYRNAIKGNNLILNDGIGMKIGMRLFNIHEKENMNGTDFIPEVINLAVNLNKNIYLLGGKPGVVDDVEKNLKKTFINCNIVGKYHGYFNKEEGKKIINDINSKKVELLIVGMGVPIQEIWLAENNKFFETVRIGIAGGAILDFLSGRISRAPKIMRVLKLEWLYRLILEPKRLWKRYLIGNIQFIYYMIIEKKNSISIKKNNNF